MCVPLSFVSNMGLVVVVHNEAKKQGCDQGTIVNTRTATMCGSSIEQMRELVHSF